MRHTIASGTCHAVFAFDVAQHVDLEGLERHVAALVQRERIRRSRRAPKYFAFDPPPLRITIPAEPIEIGRFRTSSQVSCVVHEFGVASVVFTMELTGPIADLQSLSNELYEHEAMQSAAVQHVHALLEIIRPFAAAPCVQDLIEDYVVYEIRRVEPEIAPAAFVSEHERWIAQVLRAESRPLSDQEITESIGGKVAYGTADMAIIDWNAAMLFDAEADDVIAVLEFANLELLELRHLDAQLDRVLDAAWRTLVEPRWPLFRTRAKEMRDLAKLQVESAMLFEQVNNALKLMGDQYLARLYRLASQRLHIGDWDASIRRKLETVNSTYAKVSDFQATRRMEILEWIIIVLIALSIAIGFMPGMMK